MRPEVQNVVRALRAMPPQARQQQIDSGRYSNLSPQEMKLVRSCCGYPGRGFLARLDLQSRRSATRVSRPKPTEIGNRLDAEGSTTWTPPTCSTKRSSMAGRRWGGPGATAP